MLLKLLCIQTDIYNINPILFLQGYTWKATASIFEPSNYHSSLTLTGTLEATFDLSSAQAVFNNLMVNVKGYSYIIRFHVVTDPSSEYEFIVNSDGFDVKVKGQVEHTGEAKTYSLRIDADYEAIARGNENSLRINFMNEIGPMFDGTISNVKISKGNKISGRFH